MESVKIGLYMVPYMEKDCSVLSMNRALCDNVVYVC